MYFPVSWPKYLSVGQGGKSRLKSIACNRYRMLFAVLTETTLSIWHCKPCVEIVCYQRCHSSVASVGTNELAEWRQDSSMIAITTSKGYVLLYQLEQDVRGDEGLHLYEYQQTKTNQGDSNEVVPALRLSLKANFSYKAKITSLTCIHDELLVALEDGRLEMITWEPTSDVQKSIHLCEIPFSVDLHVTGSQLKSRGVHAVDIVYSPFLEGFAVILSDGRAALVTMTQPDDSTKESSPLGWNARGVWAPMIDQATCIAVNNKYRLLAFGTEMGTCCVYGIDNVTGCLQLSHTVALSPTHYPNICKSVGSVLKIDWSPDGSAMSLAWSRGGLSVWSVFGACLVCSLASDRAYATDGTPHVQGIFKSMCWGVEGYHLWLISEQPAPPLEVSNGHVEEKKKSARRKLVDDDDDHNYIELGQLLQLQFVKSALAMNPCMTNHCHVLIHGEDRMYLSIGERTQRTAVYSPPKTPASPIKKQAFSPTRTTKQNSPRRRSTPASHNSAHFDLSRLPTISMNGKTAQEEPQQDDGDGEDGFLGSAVSNKQWTVVQFPINYLPSNWPIRFTAVDESGCCLAIAGNYGLAHYTIVSRKWKVFGNVMQEKDMVVTGGLTWWKEFIVVACYSFSESQDEIRIYPRLTNLDNAFACVKKIKSQILLVNIFQDLLILFTYDCRIIIFVISQDTKLHRPTATLRYLQEVSMARYVHYPTMVASVTLTALHMESPMRRSSSSSSFSSRGNRETEVLIVNVAGRLLLLQRSLEDDEIIEAEPNERKPMRFNPPVVLATCVENIWTTEHKKSEKIHLTDALWLGCGSAGVRVWLPLFPPRQSRHNSAECGPHRGFELQLLTARRITLTFALDSCYPLAVLFSEAVLLGVTSETFQYSSYEEKKSSKRSRQKTNFAFSTVERTCEIYLHQILRQLLRRNLGYDALQLAATCKNLACFPHVLELMLHEVLEEEATASEPIPDPLLPTVVKFLEEFPEYLQTVVHCARKTEIALWEYLFNSVGSPRELFEECLETGQLTTAASYLIILQNLEQLAVARQDATKLFDQALQQRMWRLANDIARFLRAIGDGDASATPRHPTLLNTNIYPAVAPTIHTTPTEPDPSFKFSSKPSSPTCPEDPTPPHPRRLTTRSFTESYFDIKPSPSSVTSPGNTNTSVTSSSHHPYVPRYGTRQYHQDHPHIHRPLQHSISHPLSSSSNRSKRFSGDKEPSSKEHAAAECAEHYFIDVILARQARKMLSERRLHDLGTFAAHVDFQLVPWLRKERLRAARVDDAVESFKKLHEDFNWPFPNLVASKSGRSSHSSGGFPSHSQSFTDLNSLYSPLESAISPSKSFNHNHSSPGRRHTTGPKLAHHVGLSPKRGIPGLDTCSYGTDEEGSGITTVLSAKETGSTLTLTTVASEVSEVSESSFGFDDSTFAGVEDFTGFPLIGIEMDEKRGSARCEMKLQYLLELFLEAVCLEWAVLVTLMLRDPSNLARVVRSARPLEGGMEESVPLETLQRTRDCLSNIDKWAVSECPGYKAVLIQMRSNVQALYDIITAREVSHAEEQAIIANQQKKHTQATTSPVNQNQDKTEKHTSPMTSPHNRSPVTVKKRRAVVPGTAIASVNHDDVITEEAEVTSQSDDYETNSESQESHVIITPRIRHNSVPCHNSDDCIVTSHCRTPSSPAKLIAQTSPAYLDSSDEGTINVETPQPNTETAPSTDQSQSDTFTDDVTDSEPEVDDTSACLVS
ncbi:guanine nucleotide exchange factor subunit RIC1 isoform X1 [Ciona intestinalis]